MGWQDNCMILDYSQLYHWWYILNCSQIVYNAQYQIVVYRNSCTWYIDRPQKIPYKVHLVYHWLPSNQDYKQLVHTISILHVILLPAQCLCIMTSLCFTNCWLTNPAVSKNDKYLHKNFVNTNRQILNVQVSIAHLRKMLFLTVHFLTLRCIVTSNLVHLNVSLCPFC